VNEQPIPIENPTRKSNRVSASTNRSRSRRGSRQPYMWLGMGALGVGVGAMLTGAALIGGSGVASADSSTDAGIGSASRVGGSAPGSSSGANRSVQVSFARRAVTADRANAAAKRQPVASAVRNARTTSPGGRTATAPVKTTELLQGVASNLGVTGVRGAGFNTVVLTAGASLTEAGAISPFLFVGSVATGRGTSYYPVPKFAGVTVTTAQFYGPNTHQYNPRLIPVGQVAAVGTYQALGDTTQHGMLFIGPPDGVGGQWTKIDVPSNGSNVAGGISACQGRANCAVSDTIPHSTMGNLVVGSYNLAIDGLSDPATGNGFLYNLQTQQYTLLQFGNSQGPFGGLDSLTSLYGVWQNGSSRSDIYTVVGGSGEPVQSPTDLQQHAVMATYDEKTGQFGLPSYYYPDGNKQIPSHFEGINPTPSGFALSAEYATADGEFNAYVGVPVTGRLASLLGLGSLKYGSTSTWVTVSSKTSSPPNLCDEGCKFASSDTVYRNKLMGVYSYETDGVAHVRSYLANIPLW